MRCSMPICAWDTLRYYSIRSPCYHRHGFRPLKHFVDAFSRRTWSGLRDCFPLLRLQRIAQRDCAFQRSISWWTTPGRWAAESSHSQPCALRKERILHLQMKDAKYPVCPRGFGLCCCGDCDGCCWCSFEGSILWGGNFGKKVTFGGDCFVHAIAMTGTATFPAVATPGVALTGLFVMKNLFLCSRSRSSVPVKLASLTL